MTTSEKALALHKEWNGKLETTPKCRVASREDLAIAYTPGVAEPCKKIAEQKEEAYRYTIKSNTVAVVSDGSAVLGLGNIGAEAAMPVMEGKAVLFKEFGGVNAFPICLDTQDTEEIIRTVVNIAPAFGGINLEDISAPRCFEIETRLKELLDIPVFHDDQHGTAIVVLAGIINALKVTGKNKEDCRIVVNGAGSAGIAISKLLLSYGFPHLMLCDKVGILNKQTPGLNWMQKEMMEVTNLDGKAGSLADALAGADIFVGVSAPGIVSPEMVASMNQDAILFAMANPVPEIMPDEAKRAGARVVGTGRSDFPNQVNNVVAFPGIFRGALEGRASQITEEMKLAAALAIASLVERRYDLSKPGRHGRMGRVYLLQRQWFRRFCSSSGRFCNGTNRPRYRGYFCPQTGGRSIYRLFPIFYKYICSRACSPAVVRGSHPASERSDAVDRDKAGLSAR